MTVIPYSHYRLATLILVLANAVCGGARQHLRRQQQIITNDEPKPPDAKGDELKPAWSLAPDDPHNGTQLDISGPQFGGTVHWLFS